jgi:hypothetical protein
MIFEPVMVGTITPSTLNGMNSTETSKLQSQEKRLVAGEVIEKHCD